GFSKPVLGIPVQAPATFQECIENLGTNWSNWRDGAQQCDGNLLLRTKLRWEAPSAPSYQPFSAKHMENGVGYLLGYRVYRHSTNLSVSANYDGSILVPLQSDFQKQFCQNHPDIPCSTNSPGSCPSGDSCTYHGDA